jgi:hypothetical protein
MPTFKLQASQIDVGLPLPFDTFDVNGKLLLRKGLRIESADQLERLLDRGLYSEQDPERVRHSHEASVLTTAPLPKARKVSVFDLISET